MGKEGEKGRREEEEEASMVIASDRPPASFILHEFFFKALNSVSLSPTRKTEKKQGLEISFPTNPFTNIKFPCASKTSSVSCFCNLATAFKVVGHLGQVIMLLINVFLYSHLQGQHYKWTGTNCKVSKTRYLYWLA